MCGLAGVVSERPVSGEDIALLERMMEAIRHRGPDDSGTWSTGRVALGHQRLSIIDLSGGHQPMTSVAGDRTIVFNGEIYNYQDLVRQVDPSDLATHSDTEVLMRIARTDSTEWLNQLNGMFAFALWDETTRTLLLARDRVGIKPLYYRRDGGRLIFASEIKSLLQDPDYTPRMNEDAVWEYLQFRNIVGAETMFEGIHELPPGHVAVVRPDDGEFRIQRWWKDDPVAESASDAKDLTDRLADAVRYHMIADVEVGTYNSGGVDSSLVSYFASKILDRRLHTFSVGFEEAAFDESHYSDLVAGVIGSDHHRIKINSAEYASGLEKAIWFLDEPLHHAHTVQLFALSKEARRFVKVVLTGEGADEIFAGYPRYQIPFLGPWVAKVPSGVRQLMRGVGEKTGMRRMNKLLDAAADLESSTVNQARFVDDATIRRLGGRAGSAEAARLEIFRDLASPSILETVLAYDRCTYMQSLLQRLDRTTMAHSLEARVPYLDYRLVAWSKGMRTQDKLVVGRDNKARLKDLARATFPPEIVDRRKMGFDVPLDEWLRDSKGLGARLDVLTDETFRSRGYCDADFVRTAVDDHVAGRANHVDLLWALLNLETWHRMMIDRRVGTTV